MSRSRSQQPQEEADDQPDPDHQDQHHQEEEQHEPQEEEQVGEAEPQADSEEAQEDAAQEEEAEAQQHDEPEAEAEAGGDADAVAEEEQPADEQPAEPQDEEQPAEDEQPDEQPAEEAAGEEIAEAEAPVEGEAEGDAPAEEAQDEEPLAEEEQEAEFVERDGEPSEEPSEEPSQEQAEGAGEMSAEGQVQYEDAQADDADAQSYAATEEGAVANEETSASSGETNEEKSNEQQPDGDTDRADDADGEPQAEAEPQAEEPQAEAIAEVAPIDFTGLEGLALLKAQRAHEHSIRVRELELRLQEEEEEERRHTAALLEARASQREQLDADIEEDEALVHSVELPPREYAEDALEIARAEVDDLRAQALDSYVLQPPALDEIEDDALVVDSITLEEVRSSEIEVESARVNKLRDESNGFLRRLEALKQRDIEAGMRTEKTHQALLEDVAKRKELLGASNNKWQEEQEKAFKKVQTYLAATLETQKRLLTKEYGALQEVPSIYCDGRVREPPQRSAPRLMTLKVDCLRAIKNKLPGGFYVVLVTLYDRLGGHPLRWCTLPDDSGTCHYGMTSVPQRHGGKYYNLEMSFNQDGNLLQLACPSLAEARPNNVLIFELVAVRGGRHLADRVLAWGAFPLMNANKSLIRGRFKVPLKRGEMDATIDKYTGLQKRITTDIDYWLCNLYFETNPIPLRANYKWWGTRLESVQYKIDTQAIMKGNYYKLNTSLADGMNGGSSTYSYGNSASNGHARVAVNKDSGSGPARLSTPNLPSHGGEINPFLPSKYQQRNAGPARGAIGLGKGKDAPVVDEFILPSDLVAGGANDLARKVQSRERAKELRAYKHSITNPEADVPTNPGQEKTRFLISEVLGDLSMSRITTLEFWSTIGLFVLSWWLRIYVHYFGQYLWLMTSWYNNNQVYEFTVRAWTCTIQYSVDNLTAVTTQSMVLVIGTVSNQLCLLGMYLFAWCWLRSFGSFSDAGFRFLLVYGINVMFDPVSIALVDTFAQNWSGDYFKIYNAYSTVEIGIGYAGVFLTIALAFILMLISFVIVFVYTTQLHMNGRMIDVYHRLNSDEGHFFVPNDLELSVRTLRYILAKSKRWTGFHGTKRKVLLTAYKVDDHLDRSFHDRTLHLSIYNVTPKLGKRAEQRDIFRHFVRSSDGAIIEAFDAAESMGADGYQKLEERWLSQEATSIDDQEAEAEDLLKQMLSSQKRAEAEKTGHRPRAVKSVASHLSDGSEPSMSGVGFGGGMSVVRELSEVESEAEEPQHQHDQLEHIGEEVDDEDEEEEEEEEEADQEEDA